MPAFGKRSRDRIATLDSRWKPLLESAIEEIDFTVICGHRDIEAQTRAFDSGHSTVSWPNSKHNKNPSLAVDLAPWHTDAPHIHWKEDREFIFLAGLIFAYGRILHLDIRWGGDWDGDFDQSDQTFMDIGHFEIRG